MPVFKTPWFSQRNVFEKSAKKLPASDLDSSNGRWEEQERHQKNSQEYCSKQFGICVEGWENNGDTLHYSKLNPWLCGCQANSLPRSWCPQHFSTLFGELVSLNWPWTCNSPSSTCPQWDRITGLCHHAQLWMTLVERRSQIQNKQEVDEKTEMRFQRCRQLHSFKKCLFNSNYVSDSKLDVSGWMENKADLILSPRREKAILTPVT